MADAGALKAATDAPSDLPAALMRYIDAFNHFFPKRYYEALLETPAGARDLGKRVRGIPALSDLESTD